MCQHAVFRVWLLPETLVARLPLSSSGRGNEAYGPTSTAPSKTDVHKQTKWQQTGGGRGEGGWGRRGRYSTEVECFHVLMAHKRELFPPAVQYMGWYCPWHSWGCKADLEANAPLMGSWCCYYPIYCRDGWQQLVMKSLKFSLIHMVRFMKYLTSQRWNKFLT